MKWGFVDNYQVPKRSYDYVKKAYQPLLVSLKYDKRRWKNKEAFQAEIWIVNDFYRQYEDCLVEMKLKAKSGEILKEETFSINEIHENSSKKMFDINWKVLEAVEGNFYAELSLKDNVGQELSANDYMLLIGDKEKAAQKFKEMGEEIRARNSKYSYGNYHRFFPDMINENGKSYQSRTEVPRARGFEKNKKD